MCRWLIIFIIWGFLSLLIISASAVYAVDVVITAYPPGSLVGMPINFTVTELGELNELSLGTLQFDWEKGFSSNYTMIRGKAELYPAGVDEGEEIYYGDATSFISSGYALDFTDYKFSAWGFWTDNISHSYGYARAYIGGELMTNIADAINGLMGKLGDFNILMVIAIIVPLAFFTWLTIKIDSDWGSPILAFITGGISFMLGFSAPDIVNGKYETTAFGLTMAVGLVIYSLLCLIWAWGMMFRGRGKV